MQISDYVQPDTILLNLEVDTKDDLVRRLIAAAEKTPVYAAQPADVRRKVGPMIMERESYGSTAIGHGILFPHARIPGFRDVLLLVATCRRPLDIPTPDGEPVFLTCFAVVPAERPSLGLKVAAALARLFKNPSARRYLSTAPTPEAVAEYIAEHDETLETTIQVRDVSRAYEWTAVLDTPVREIARQLLRHRMPGVAVLDSDGVLQGEITLTRLQRFGLPNFFLNLKSVSFVRQFDPFEQYFQREAQAVAGDLMNADAATLPEDGTLMEAIHALAVNRRAMVHVLREGKAVGYVDSVAVLNRVLSP